MKISMNLMVETEVPDGIDINDLSPMFPLTLWWQPEGVNGVAFKVTPTGYAYSVEILDDPLNNVTPITEKKD